MHARTGLHTHNQACVCRQDYVYASPCPENLKTRKIEHKQEKPNPNTLACSKPKQNYILP